ncbi:MAG TPA: thioesterase family protein [Vicinamibacteria bacterium]|nr:thioesterase family protein [Vicinamibacteria bacterium]
MFTTSILVRFGDLDGAGIAYYPSLVNFLHVAFEDFFTGHVGIPYPEVFKGGLGLPMVKVDMEFFSPVHYGDRVEVGVVVERVGNSSVQIRYEGSVQGKPVFRARNTGVIVDMKTFKPTAIPAWLRERLQAAMETPAARPTS